MASLITTLKDVPRGTPMSVSIRSTRDLVTGSWRTMRPSYVAPPSPCNLDCPAGTDVRGFLTRAADGDARDAWHVIREHNPLPGICGRVCYHPCENDCNRATLDEPLAVHAVERAIAEEARLRQMRPRFGPVVLPPRLAAVVGSGPAGLSCAYHLARQGCGVTVFDAMPRPGGMLRYGIPKYRLPRETLDHEIALLHQMGVNFVCNTRVGPEIGALGSFDAVFVAVGLQRSKPVALPGSTLPGVQSGLALLREVNAGHIVPLSGPVVVIGGGNTAIDAARSALRLGGEPTIVYRRAREDMPAHPDEIAQAEAEGIAIEFHAAPTQFVERGGRVGAAEFQRMRPGATDASGRRRPEPIPGATFSLDAALVLTAIGEELEDDAIGDLVECVKGQLKADRWGRTSRTPIFAGGDAATGAGTVVEAIGSGRRAAEGIAAHFAGRTLSDGDGAQRVGPADLNLFYFRSSARIRAPHRPATDVLRSFEEVVGSLPWAQAVEEAQRCFSCGSCTHCDNCVTFCPDGAVRRDPATGGYAIDLVHCKGCGLCAAECPRGALTLVPEEQR